MVLLITHVCYCLCNRAWPRSSTPRPLGRSRRVLLLHRRILPVFQYSRPRGHRLAGGGDQPRLDTVPRTVDDGIGRHPGAPPLQLPGPIPWSRVSRNGPRTQLVQGTPWSYMPTCTVPWRTGLPGATKSLPLPAITLRAWLGGPSGTPFLHVRLSWCASRHPRVHHRLSSRSRTPGRPRTSTTPLLVWSLTMTGRTPDLSGSPGSRGSWGPLRSPWLPFPGLLIRHSSPMRLVAASAKGWCVS